jgi:hypothetical protein
LSGLSFVVATLGDLAGIAKVICARGDYARAARVLGAADALDESNDVRRQRYWEIGDEWLVAELEGKLGPEPLARLRAAGRALSRDEAIALALTSHAAEASTSPPHLVLESPRRAGARRQSAKAS